MNKSILFLGLIFYSTLSFSQNNHNKKNEEMSGKLIVALAIPYSFELNTVGVNGRLYYNVNHHICFGPEVSYFKKNEVSIIDLNFVGHYIFEVEKLKIGIYPLVGINYTIENEPLHQNKEVGLVFGAGLHKTFNKLFVFGEFSHVQSHLKDNFVTVGAMYLF